MDENLEIQTIFHPSSDMKYNTLFEYLRPLQLESTLFPSVVTFLVLFFLNRETTFKT